MALPLILKKPSSKPKQAQNSTLFISAAKVINELWQSRLRSPRLDAWKITTNGLEYNGSQHPISSVKQCFKQLLLDSEMEIILSCVVSKTTSTSMSSRESFSGFISNQQALTIISKAHDTKISDEDVKKTLGLLNINTSIYGGDSWTRQDNLLTLKGDAVKKAKYENPDLLWDLLYNVGIKSDGTEEQDKKEEEKKEHSHLFSDEEVKQFVSGLESPFDKDLKSYTTLNSANVFKMCGSKIKDPSKLVLYPITRTLESQHRLMKQNLPHDEFAPDDFCPDPFGDD